MFQLSYINYLVMLFVLSGGMVLLFDTKIYKQEQQTKEEKVSRFFGWTNIGLGVLAYVANWVVQQWVL